MNEELYQKLYELYQKLYDAQYYTKSYDDFKAKYGTPEGQQDLYNKLSSAQFYTKDFDSFKQKYFSEDSPKSKSVSFWDGLRNSVPFVRPIVNAIDSIIPEQTKEAVGSMVEDYSKVNTEPPKPNFFENAIKRGTNLAKQAEIVNPFSESPNPAQIQELASIQQENQNLPPSESYAKFNNSQSFGEALDNFSKDPARIILELTTESLSSLAQYGLTRVGAGAATGAAMGSVVPGIGTAAGAGSGAIVGLADTSLGLEYSSAFMDSLKEAGVDVNNPSSLEKAFQDDAIISEARAHGLKKGIPIALFDLISGGVAGKIVTKPAKSILGKVAQGASEFGVQAALGGTGELSGQLVAGEEIQPGAILGEMIGELGTTPVEVGLGASSRIKNTLKQSNEVINKVADTGSNEINAAIDADATLTKEEQEQLANKIKENEKEQTKEGKQEELLTDTQAGIKREGVERQQQGEEKFVWTKQSGRDKTINGEDWIKPISEWWENSKDGINKLVSGLGIDKDTFGNWLNATSDEPGVVATRITSTRGKVTGTFTLFTDGTSQFQKEGDSTIFKFDFDGNLVETETRKAGSVVGGEKSILNSDTDLRGDKKEPYMLLNDNSISGVQWLQVEAEKYPTKKISVYDIYPKSVVDRFLNNPNEIHGSAKQIFEDLNNGVAISKKPIIQKNILAKGQTNGFDKYIVADGYHRIQALLAKGITEIEVKELPPDIQSKYPANEFKIKNEIENAIKDGKYQKAISEGRMTATDAVKIIESAGLEVPKDIAEQSLQSTPQAGVVGANPALKDVESTAKTFDQTPEFQAANQKIREIAEQIRENPQDRTLTTKLNEAIQEQDNARIAFEKRPKREKQTPIVVTNPAQALKEQIQQHYRTLEQGIKKGQKMTNESLLSKVEDVLKKASKAGVNFTNQQFNSIVNKVKSSNLFTPGSLSKLQNYVDNVFNDAEYLNKINEAKLINKKLRRLSKTSSSNLQSIKSLAKSFTKINPEDTFINEHLMEANKLLSALTTPTSKGYSITNLSDTEEYINRKIDEANEYLEKETASVSEDNSDDLTNRLKTKLKESLKALQSKDLSEFDDSERTAIEDIKRTNPDLLEKASLIRAIRVIDNIVENDNLSNEAELRTDVKSLEVLNEIETLLKGKKLGVPTGFYAKLTYSVARTWERIIGDNTLVAKIKLAMGQQGITDASSKTETQLNKRVKEIEKVLQIFEKETQQPFMDVSNRAKVLVYSLLVRHPQGADTSTVIQKMKDNIVKSISEYRIAEETEIANAMQSAYDEVKDLNTLEEIESTWSAKNPSHRKVFDYFTNMFKELTDEQESIQSRLFNKSYLRENNYTHFTVLNLNGEKKQVTTDKSGAKSTIKPKEATTSIKATRSLPPGSVYSLDFIHDQLEAYGETYYKNKASDSMLLINKVMNNPKFNEIFGKKTADIIRKQSNQINDIYSGIGGAPSSQFIKLLSAGTKLSRELAAAQTLGSISQVPKQFLPVLVKSISFHLSKGSFPILLRSLGIRGEGVNKLHELYPVGTVGLRLGGIDRGDTISYNLSAGSGKKIIKFLEDSLKISRKLVRGSLFWLTTPDRFAKKATWNSYYLLRLKELGVTDVNMAAEYSLQKDPRRREAAAYAEQMLSTTQISSNPAEFSDITSNKGNNAEKIIKNVLLPFAVYSIEVKARLVNNTIKAFKRPTSENIVGGIIGDLLEIATFEAIAMFLIPQYKEFLDDIWRDIFDLEKPDEDEDKKKEKILKTGLSRAVNTINPFAIGSIGEEVGNRSINLLAFKALADDPDMDYKTWKKETGGFAYEDKFDFGLLTLGYKPAFNIYNNTVNLQRASDDEKISYEDDYGNVYDVYLDENQKKLLALNLLAEISSLSGANEADLFNSLRRVYKEQVKMQKKQPYNK